MCTCPHEGFSAATALSLDGWSFSLACSCLMNPAVHVLIECFLCSHVPHSPPLSPWHQATPPIPHARTSLTIVPLLPGPLPLWGHGGTQTNNDTCRNTHLLTCTHITLWGRWEKGKASTSNADVFFYLVASFSEECPWKPSVSSWRWSCCWKYQAF